MKAIHPKALIYSKKGNQIFPRIGLTLHAGSFIKCDNEFITLDKNYIIVAGEKDYVSDVSDRKMFVSYGLKEIS